MSTIAFIGLGIMGGPMAGHLVQAGHIVIGVNRSPAPVQRLVEAGGRGAESVAEAVAKADVIITMVPDSPDVEGLALGDDGIYANARSGAIHLDMSSIRPDVSVRLAEAGRERGIRVLDAPGQRRRGGCQGSHAVDHGRRRGGRLQGGQADHGGGRVDHRLRRPDRHPDRPSRRPTSSSSPGPSSWCAEAIVFLEAYGVDTEAAIAVLAGGLAGNRILDRKGATMLARQFEPGFRIDLHHKDMGIVTDAARAKGVAIPLGALTAQLVGALRAQGDGGLDHSALLKGVERLSGRDD